MRSMTRDSEVSEWVGQHYGLHWESLSDDRRQDFRERFAEANDLDAEQEDATCSA